MTRALLALALVTGVGHATPGATLLTGLRVGNGGRPYLGDSRLVTSISPNRDGLRDAALIQFTLARPAQVTIGAYATRELLGTRVWSFSRRLDAGRRVVVWHPKPWRESRAYLIRIRARDDLGNVVEYGKADPHAPSPPQGPVVKIRGLDAGFTRPSYAPGATATLRIASDVPGLELQFFRAGLLRGRAYRRDALQGRPVGKPRRIDWRGHGNRPGTVRLRLGPWPTGVYFARLTRRGSRVGFAPFVIRPRRLGTRRVGVVISTNTWQAYNFQDANGDGWGDTWYAAHAEESVRIGRIYYRSGAPEPWLYDRGFVRWLARNRKDVDYLSDEELQATTGDRLARLYTVLIFPGHAEYVTGKEFSVVQRYRDRGGNLMFLSANNFYRRVDRSGTTLTLKGLWRQFGRPEERLIGVRYDRFLNLYGAYVVTGARDAPWLFRGTGLRNGSRLPGFGREIDQRSPLSPPGTIRLAWIPNLFGPGESAEMTYYRRGGAKVFAAGTVNFGTSALRPDVGALIANLWTHMTKP